MAAILQTFTNVFSKKLILLFHSNFTEICSPEYSWQNGGQVNLDPQKTSHTSPKWASYGVSFVNGQRWYQ